MVAGSNLLKYSQAICESKAFSYFCKDVRGKRFSHACLFVTPDTAIKDSLIKLVCAEIFCDNSPACLSCPDCRRVINRSHPDIHYFPASGAKITVGDIDALVSEINIMSYSGDERIFVIDCAETMQPASQNKLLKTLEDAPENSVIMLFASTDAGLLPTVKSRVKTFWLAPFTAEQIGRELPPSAPLGVAAMARGSITAAKKALSDPDYARMEAQIFGMLPNLSGSRDIPRFAAEVFAYSQKLDEYLKLLASFLTDILYFKARGGEFVLNKSRISDIIKAEAQFSVSALILINDYIVHCLERLTYYGNAQAVVDGLLLYIAEVKNKCR